jgi:hypothetical protein
MLTIYMFNVKHCNVVKRLQDILDSCLLFTQMVSIVQNNIYNLIQTNNIFYSISHDSSTSFTISLSKSAHLFYSHSTLYLYTSLASAALRQTGQHPLYSVLPGHPLTTNHTRRRMAEAAHRKQAYVRTVLNHPPKQLLRHYLLLHQARTPSSYQLNYFTTKEYTPNNKIEEYVNKISIRTVTLHYSHKVHIQLSTLHNHFLTSATPSSPKSLEFSN